MKASLLAVALCAAAATTGCASIVSGTNQPIAVETRLNGDPLAGASCKLTSNKGTWFVNTPGSIVVHRGFQDLAVECAKSGLPTTFASIASSTKAMAFGNILFGGVIGVGVDVGTGAAYDYPSLISIEMGPNVNATSTVAGPVVATAATSSTLVTTAAATTPVTTMAAAAPATTSTAPVMPRSIERPTQQVVVASSQKEMKYQISAEAFAKSQACSTKPLATLTSSGPGSETYTIPCASGEALIARCEFGNCRAMN